MSDYPAVPQVLLDARDPHVPPLLKALAAKHRGMNPDLAASLDQTADSFAAWKRANMRVK